MDIKIKNAIIKSAKITTEDGFLCVWLDLDYGGTGQGFGGYTLYLPKTWKQHDPKGPNYAGHFIWRVMEIAGVTRWDDVVGRTIRVQTEHTKSHAIGHIINDDWFNPSKDFAQFEEAA